MKTPLNTDLGSSQDDTTPKAQGHEADNRSALCGNCSTQTKIDKPCNHCGLTMLEVEAEL